jgi:hypothetical protein
MPAFSLRSPRLCGESVVHHLSENIKLPNDPSPISGQCADPWPLLARAHRAIPNEPSKLLKTMDRFRTLRLAADEEWAGPGLPESAAQACSVQG